MTNTEIISEVSQIEARRIDSTHDGKPVYSADCPFCRVEAVDACGEAVGCPHLRQLEHHLSGSYFTFEK